MARSAVRRSWSVFVAAMLVASAASAQSIITGTVRDVSGAAMPGVTVEAASPVLIEKVKAVVSDGNGNYRITDLRPGIYSVSFTLPGFNTYRREGARAAVRLHRHAQRRAQGRRARRNHHGHRRVADRRRVEHLARAGAVARSARRDPERPDDLRHVAAGDRRGAEHARRGRLARDAADLHVDARPHLRQQHRPDRRLDDQRPRRRRRRAAVHQQPDDPGNELHHGRRGRRRVAGRRARQRRDEGRRQPVQRHVLRRLERRQVAVRQP